MSDLGIAKAVKAWLVAVRATWREMTIALTQKERERFVSRIEKLALDSKESEERTYRRLIEWADGLCDQLGALAKTVADIKASDRKERAALATQIEQVAADVKASEERTYKRLVDLAESLGSPLHVLAKKVAGIKGGRPDMAHALNQDVRDVRSDTLALLALVEGDGRRLDRLEMMLEGLTSMRQGQERQALEADGVPGPVKSAVRKRAIKQVQAGRQRSAG